MKKILLSLVLIVSIISVKAQNNSIDKITTLYISLKNALVGSNAQLAKSKSKELLAALSVPTKELKPAQQKLLATYAEKLKFDSKHISETASINNQRKSFESLSKICLPWYQD